nr:PepSY domain-containing protein [Myxococcales bacterium]
MLVHPGTRLPVLVVLSLLAASCQPTHSPDDPVDRDPSTEPLPQTTSTPTATPASTVALAHLTEHAGGVEEIVPIGEGTDALGMTHVRFQQLHGGVAVLGGQAIVHVGSDGTVVSVTDDFVPELTVDAVPNVDEQDAIDAAMAAFDGAPTPRGSRLAVTVEEGTPLLVWLVQLTDDDQFWPVEQEFLVDAHTGEVIRWIDTLHTARDRAIYDADQTFDLPGTLARSEGDAATGDTQVDAAYANLGTS